MLKSQIQACVLSSYETRSADPTCTLEVKHFGNDQETKPHIKVKTALQILFFFFPCEMVKDVFGKQVGMAKRK